MLRRFSSLAFGLLAVAFAAPAAQAQLVTYTFTGAAGDEVTLPADAQPSGATASPIRRGTGLTPNLAGGAFGSSGFGTQADRDTADYVAFTVTPDVGRTLTLDSLVFDERRSGTGLRTFAVYSSLDGYAAPLTTVTVPDDTNVRTLRLALGTAFSGVSTAVQFRLYGYGAEASTGTWRQDNIRIVGTVGTGGGEPTQPTVRFDAVSQTVAETAGSVAVTLRRDGDLSAGSTVSVRATGGTATADADYTFATTSVTFAPNEATRTVSVTLVNDTAAEPTETLLLGLELPQGAAIGTPSTFTLSITDDDTGAGTGQTIQDARDAAVGSTVTVEGIVTRAMGAFVRIQDPTAGLTLRATTGGFFDAVASGAVAAGDLIRVTGITSEFNGLLQINAADLQSFTVVSRGNALPTPAVVTLATVATAGEDYESELIRVVDLTTTASGAFAPATTYVVTDGTGTADVRTPNAADATIDGEPIPSGAFVFEGVLSQFKTATTTGDGYQLLPVLATDITPSGPAGPTSVVFASASALTTENAGTYSVSVAIANPDAVNATSVDVAIAGGTATLGSDYTAASPVTLTFPAGSRTPQTVRVTLLTDTVTEGEETVVFRLQNVSGGNAAAVGTPAEFTLRIADGGATGGGTVCPGLTGTDLLSCLRTGYSRTTTVSYNSARDALYGSFYPDADPSTSGMQYRGVYTGRTGSLGGGGSTTQLDTEHTWPRSQMPNSGSQEGDMHNLYPTISKVNNDRGSLPFDEIDDAAATGWYGPVGSLPTSRPTTDIDLYSERSSSAFEPREDHKGNVARAMAYFYTVYGTGNQSFWLTVKDNLIAWNTLDPADQLERERSTFIKSRQGNENPFILDATLMQRAFGTSVSTSAGERPFAFTATLSGARPVRSALSVSVSLPSTSPVTVEVFDVAGRRVAVASTVETAGTSVVSVDVAGLPSGTYVARVRAGADAASLPFVHLR